jgi:purine-nucleoside phosphorylase
LDSYTYCARVEEAAEYLQSRFGDAPGGLVVLGSGLDGAARFLRAGQTLSFEEIPYFPQPSVLGHAGLVSIGAVGPNRVALQRGRVHLYEGYSPWEVVFSVRVFAWWGCRLFVLTNSSGAISQRLSPGEFMLLSDHINLLGCSPLEGLRTGGPLGNPFVNLNEAYDRQLNEVLSRVSAATNVAVKSGVYACVRGPNFETPAEIHMLRSCGADAVGMSTVPEVIALRQMGRPLVGLSCVTNWAAGISGSAPSHQEVAMRGERSSEDLSRLLRAFWEQELEQGEKDAG